MHGLCLASRELFQRTPVRRLKSRTQAQVERKTSASVFILLTAADPGGSRAGEEGIGAMALEG